MCAWQVVGLIAAALEHAADRTADCSQKTAGDSAERSQADMPSQPVQRDDAAESVAAQLQDFAVNGCSASSETSVIAEQVPFLPSLSNPLAGISNCEPYHGVTGHAVLINILYTCLL